MQIVVDKLEKSFGIQEVFKDVSFMIAKGEKIGLVGVNGSGKSTLVKCLLQPDYADRGTISFEPGIRVGYVEQGFGSIGNESLWDFMMKANPEILSLRKKLKELEGKLKAVMDACETQSMAALARQYRETIREIEEIESIDEQDEISDIINGLSGTDGPDCSELPDE